MSKSAMIEELVQPQLKTDIPHFCVGDKVSVHVKIVEGNKERVQVFTGTVIARKGSGISETFSVHRVAYGEGMERVFLLNSPRVVKIEVIKEGDVRRSKLYYLRGTQGKAARVKGRVVSRSMKKSSTQAETAAVEETAIVAEENTETATTDHAGTESSDKDGASKSTED